VIVDKKETKGFVDNNLLRKIAADVNEIKGRVGEDGLGQRIETAEKNIIDKIGRTQIINFSGLLNVLNDILEEMRTEKGISAEELEQKFRPIVQGLQELGRD
jgi:hypothetical protein